MKSSRRKLLKALTLGGSAATVMKLPSTWSRPVLETVALPVHAQATNCVITVDFRLEFTGYDGGADFYLFDQTQCYEYFERGVPFNETFTFPLGPGTYFFAGGGGAGGPSGSLDMELIVSCCDQSERVTASASGNDSDSDGMLLLITILDDGRCEIDTEAPIPKPGVCL